MKVVLLAGGFGSRISEESVFKNRWNANFMAHNERICLLRA